MADNDLEKKVEDFEARGDANLPDVQSTSLIQLALEKKYDPALIEKMMDLQERNEARLAKQAYVVAMAAFKADPPKILKDRKVEYQPSGKSKISYSHADLATSLEQINTALSPHGLFASWRTNQVNGTITVTCVIAHSMGHSESTHMTAGPDDTGSKNKIQAMGSTVYYLMRYTLFALLGLAARGEDTNGVPEEVEYINEKQLSTVVDMINDLEVDETKFLEFLSKATGHTIESVAKIPAKEFNRAMTDLKRKKRDVEK